MVFRSRYDGVVNRVQVICGPSRTKPEFAKDCDLNLIMARYLKTGILPDSAKLAAKAYGDFSGVPSYQEMRDKVLAAEALFAALPAKVRDSFDNSPQLFMDASKTVEGMKLMVDLGLAVPRALEGASDEIKADPKVDSEVSDEVVVAKSSSKAKKVVEA